MACLLAATFFGALWPLAPICGLLALLTTRCCFAGFLSAVDSQTANKQAASLYAINFLSRTHGFSFSLPVCYYSASISHQLVSPPTPSTLYDIQPSQKCTVKCISPQQEGLHARWWTFVSEILANVFTKISALCFLQRLFWFKTN